MFLLSSERRNDFITEIKKDLTNLYLLGIIINADTLSDKSQKALKRYSKRISRRDL